MLACKLYKPTRLIHSALRHLAEFLERAPQMVFGQGTRVFNVHRSCRNGSFIGHEFLVTPSLEESYISSKIDIFFFYREFAINKHLVPRPCKLFEQMLPLLTSDEPRKRRNQHKTIEKKKNTRLLRAHVYRSRPYNTQQITSWTMSHHHVQSSPPVMHSTIQQIAVNCGAVQCHGPGRP